MPLTRSPASRQLRRNRRVRRLGLVLPESSQPKQWALQEAPGARSPVLYRAAEFRRRPPPPRLPLTTDRLSRATPNHDRFGRASPHASRGQGGVSKLERTPVEHPPAVCGSSL